MLEIEPLGLTRVEEDNLGTVTRAHEFAMLVCVGGEIHPELASLMPGKTTIVPLISSDGRRKYHVVTYGGFTIEQFIKIIMFFDECEPEEAYSRIKKLKLSLEG